MRKFIKSVGTLVTTTSNFTKDMSSFLTDDRSTLLGQANKNVPDSKNSDIFNYLR